MNYIMHKFKSQQAYSFFTQMYKKVFYIGFLLLICINYSLAHGAKLRYKSLTDFRYALRTLYALRLDMFASQTLRKKSQAISDFISRINNSLLSVNNRTKSAQSLMSAYRLSCFLSRLNRQKKNKLAQSQTKRCARVQISDLATRAMQQRSKSPIWVTPLLIAEKQK